MQDVQLYTVERTSPESGNRIQRSFTNAAKAAEFFAACEARGQAPSYVETPQAVRDQLVRLT